MLCVATLDDTQLSLNYAHIVFFSSNANHQCLPNKLPVVNTLCFVAVEWARTDDALTTTCSSKIEFY